MFATLFSASAAQAFGIVLREGLEAMLIITALAAFVKRSGAAHFVKALYGGALAALVASAGAAWVFATQYSGGHSDGLEAGVMLLAAGLMLYMSGWMFVKQAPRAWQAHLKALANKALARQTMVWVAMRSFLAVFREGSETVLFLYAATAQSGWVGVSEGALVAGMVLVGLFFAMQKLALRIPLRPPVYSHLGIFIYYGALSLSGGRCTNCRKWAGCRSPRPLPAGESSWEALSLQISLIAAAAYGALTYRQQVARG